MISRTLEWLARDHLPVDREYTKQDASWEGLLVAVGLNFGLTAAASTTWGRTSLAVRPDVLWTIAVVHAVYYLLNVAVVRHRFAEPAWWPSRMLSYAVTAAAAAAYGATSSHSASPAWFAYLAFGLYASRYVGYVPASIVAFALPPLALRWLTLPEPGGLALVVALGAVVSTLLLFRVGTRRQHSIRGAATRLEALAELTREAEGRLASLAVAMSLHDGLSGALLAARQRAARATEPESALDAGRSVLRRVHTLLSAGAPAEDVLAVIDRARELARALGTAVTFRVTGGPDHASAEDIDDLGAILTELVANEAAHGSGEGASIAVDISSRRLKISTGFQTMPVGANALGDQLMVSGRGLRNIQRRAQSHGGTLSVGALPSSGQLVVEWPLDRWHATLRGYELLLLGGLALGGGALALASRQGGPVAVTLAALALCWGYLPRMGAKRQRDLAAATLRRRAAERAPVLLIAREALLPSCEHLETALATRNRRETQAALDELAASLGDFLWALEWEGSVAELEAELRALGCHGREVPTEAASDLRQRWLLRRSQCEPALLAPGAGATSDQPPGWSEGRVA